MAGREDGGARLARTEEEEVVAAARTERSGGGWAPGSQALGLSGVHGCTCVLLPYPGPDQTKQCRVGPAGPTVPMCRVWVGTLAHRPTHRSPISYNTLSGCVGTGPGRAVLGRPFGHH